VCAITDISLAIPENELRFAQAEVCPSPQTDLPPILENPDTTETVFTFSRKGNRKKGFLS
jgi:hypothetical protein